MINPDDYWVNNPLITPVNKALMYDNDIDNAKFEERERIIELLKSMSDWYYNKAIARIGGNSNDR